MGIRDPRLDAYIARQNDFAKPILDHLRDVVHAACPDVEETMKWSAPHFDYKGQMMCSMAAFKEHAVFGFWKSSLINGLGPTSANGGEAAGNMDKKAKAAFETFPPGHRREYVEWIVEGKSRNWKYAKD